MPNKKIKRIKVSGETYDIADANAVQKSGDTMTGNLIMSGSSGQRSTTQISATGISFSDGINSSVSIGPTGLSGEEVHINSYDDWYASSDIIVNGKTGVKVISNYLDPGFTYNTRSYYVFGNINETEGTAANPATVATREWTQDWVTSQAEEFDYDTVVTALGYEPVNKAGDTMTGELVVGNEDFYTTIDSDEIRVFDRGSSASLSTAGLNFGSSSSSIANEAPLTISSDCVGGNPNTLSFGYDGVAVKSVLADEDLNYYQNYYVFGDKNNPSVTEGTALTPAVIATREWVNSTVNIGSKVSKTGDTMTGDLKLSSYMKSDPSPKISVEGGVGARLDIYDDSMNGATINRFGAGPLKITADSGISIDNITVPNGTTGKTFATTDQIPSTDGFVAKTGDTMTGELKIQNGDVSYEGKLSLGGGLSLEAASGYADINSGYALTLSTPDTDITMESHYISLSASDSKVNISDNSGVTFDSKIQGTGSYEKGYYKLPSGDGSTSTNRYTLATQEWVTANAGGAKNIKDETPTGALSQLKDGTTFTFINPNSQYNNENLPIGASGQYATSLGGKSRANGKRSLATGTSTFAFGDYSHVEGNASISEGIASHAEGLQTVARGDRAHAEGQLTFAAGTNAHAEGYSTIANSYSSHTEGAYTKTGISDRNGIVQWVSMSAGSFAVAEAAGKTLSVVSASVSRGTIQTNVESGSNYVRYVISNAGTVDDSHKVLVRIVYAINGSTPTPPGPTPDPSVDSGNTLNHAEGYMTQAFGAAAHSEGHTTAALGQYSHAEGIGNVAFGLASHVEGANNEANGQYSHAGGSLTKVNGMSSIAVGGGLIANSDHQAVFGKYNLDNTSPFVIGGGDSDNSRSDLFVVNAGGVYYNGREMAIKADVSSDLNMALANYYTKSEIAGQGFVKSSDLAVIKGAGAASFKTSNSTVANQGSAAIGYGTTATGWGTLSFGASSKATQSYAVAGGQASEANAEHSFAFGEVVKTTNQYQVAFGKYNAMKSGTVFEIGYGTSSKRENVFEVHEDGHAEVKLVGTTDASVVTKKYVDDAIGLALTTAI